MVRTAPMSPENNRSQTHYHHLSDIRALTPSDPALIEKARPAFQKYNEDQLASVKLPGGSQNVRTGSFCGGYISSIFTILR